MNRKKLLSKLQLQALNEPTNRSENQASKLSSEAGLTLVEIIIVLIILAAVVTFLASRVVGAGGKAKWQLNNVKMQSVKGYIEQYQLTYNRLPQTIDDLAQCTQATGPGCLPVTTEENLLDAWGNKFVLTLENGGRTYKLSSFGADGVAGGTDVNSDPALTGP